MRLTAFIPGAPQPHPAGGILRRQFRVGQYTVTVTKDLAAMAPRARAARR